MKCTWIGCNETKNTKPLVLTKGEESVEVAILCDEHMKSFKEAEEETRLMLTPHVLILALSSAEHGYKTQEALAP